MYKFLRVGKQIQVKSCFQASVLGVQQCQDSSLMRHSIQCEQKRC